MICVHSVQQADDNRNPEPIHIISSRIIALFSLLRLSGACLTLTTIVIEHFFIYSRMYHWLNVKNI